MTDRIITKLYSLGKNTFEVSVLQKWCNVESYSAFAELVSELEKREIISPVKASKTNGCNPPLYIKYRILPAKEETQLFDSELDAMHYLIHTDTLRRSPKKYQKHRTFLLCLSDFLKKHSDTLSFPMSENERAYAIWGYEKMLDSKENISLLKECRVWDLLHTYPTPEPFFDYRRYAFPKNVLVIENKDTWFSMRKLMIESSADQFWEIPIDCLVYGEGNKITQRDSSLEQYLNIDKSFHGTVWYWGDLDPEGIGFFLSAGSLNTSLQLQLFLPAYEEMLYQFEQRLAAPHSASHYHVHTNQKHPEHPEKFYSLFPGHISVRLQELINKGYYIPQEILHYQLLKSYSRTERIV